MVEGDDEELCAQKRGGGGHHPSMLHTNMREEPACNKLAPCSSSKLQDWVCDSRDDQAAVGRLIEQSIKE